MIGMSKKPIEEQVSAYLHYCEYKRRFTASTMQSKKQTLYRFMRENSNLKDLRRLTNEQFDNWCANLVKEGKAGKTVNSYADHITACLRFLQNKRCEKVRLRLEALERCEEDPPETVYFTADNIAKIKEYCNNLRESLLVSLLFDSALRLNELTNLRVENIEAMSITIVGKGRKKRTVFILPETRDLLDKWLIIAGVTEGYIFPSPTKPDASITSVNLRAAVNAPIRRAGFGEGSAHAIRRGALTHLLEGGLSLQDTATYAGHTDPQTTLKHYYKVTNKELGRRFTQAMQQTA